MNDESNAADSSRPSPTEGNELDGDEVSTPAKESPEWRLRSAIVAESGVSEAFDACFKGRPNGAEILSAFNGDWAWLADLVQVDHLIIELKAEASIVTRAVIGQWLVNGNTRGLVKLSDRLLDDGKCDSVVEARIRALLASVLAILRPERAKRLLETAEALLSESSSDNELAGEATAWVEAGALLVQSPLSDRKFWNRRLREPDEEWEWESGEARLALANLSRILAAGRDQAELFRMVVPGAWWDLMESFGAAALPEDVAGSATLGRVGHGKGWLVFAAGSLFGGVLLLSAVALIPELARSLVGDIAEQADKTNAPLVVVSSSPASEGTKSAEVAIAATDSPGGVQSAPEARDGSADWRTAMIARMRQSFEQLDRMQSLIRDSGLKSAEVPLRGGSSMAPFGSPAHVALLEWLMIDPPKDPDVRRATQRIYLQTAPRPQVIALLEKLAVPDGPYYQEIQVCAQLLLDSSPVNAPKAEMDRLTGIVAAHQ